MLGGEQCWAGGSAGRGAALGGGQRWVRSSTGLFMSEWSMQTECLHMHEMTNLFILPPHHADPPTSEAAVSVSAVLVIAISLVVALAAQASMLPLPT